MIIHNWEISNIERLDSNDVITLIYWRCLSNKGEYLAKKVGELTLTGSPSNEGFIPFENITEEIVQGWVTSNVDKSFYENLNTEDINEIEALDTEPSISEGLPWKMVFEQES